MNKFIVRWVINALALAAAILLYQDSPQQSSSSG